MVLQTLRLIIRPFTIADHNFIIQLLNSKGWIEYIGDFGIQTPQQATDYIHNKIIKSYQQNNFGLYAVLLNLNPIPTLIGMCGIVKRPQLYHPDLGFAFLPQYTQQGYAFEAAQAILQHTFFNLKITNLLAITLPHNAPSIKLLTKLKFEYTHNLIINKETLSVYKLDKENF